MVLLPPDTMGHDDVRNGLAGRHDAVDRLALPVDA
jgi:hypothetical protein